MPTIFIKISVQTFHNKKDKELFQKLEYLYLANNQNYLFIW